MTIALSVTHANEDNNEINNNLKTSTEILEEVNFIKTSPQWSFNKIRIRTRGKIGLEVPYFAKLEIKPFIEFHFTEK